MTLVQQQLKDHRLQRRGDQRRRPEGRHHLRLRRQQARAAKAVDEHTAGRAPAAARRRWPRSSRAPAPCARCSAAATTWRRASQLGDRRRPSRARRSRRSPSRRASSDGFTLDATLRRQLAATRYPNGETVRNEGESASAYPSVSSYGTAISLTGRDRAVRQHGVRRPDRHRWRTGRQKVIDAAVAAGIPRDSGDLEPNLGVALGSATVPTCDMANGYATFAPNGVQPRLVRHRGGQRSQRAASTSTSSRPTRAFSPAVASNVTYALQQVVDGRHRCRTRRRSNGRPPARPARRPLGTADDAVRVVVVVRRLHTAAGDRGDVHARRRQRLARAATSNRSSVRTTRPRPGRRSWSSRSQGQPVRELPGARWSCTARTRPTSPPPTTLRRRTTTPTTTTPTTTHRRPRGADHADDADDTDRRPRSRRPGDDVNHAPATRPGVSTDDPAGPASRRRLARCRCRRCPLGVTETP